MMTLQAPISFRRMKSSKENAWTVQRVLLLPNSRLEVQSPPWPRLPKATSPVFGAMHAWCSRMLSEIARFRSMLLKLRKRDRIRFKTIGHLRELASIQQRGTDPGPDVDIAVLAPHG